MLDFQFYAETTRPLLSISFHETLPIIYRILSTSLKLTERCTREIYVYLRNAEEI